MKYLVTITLAMFALAAQAEDKKVCHEINGKKECKVVKLHKKAEQVTTGDPSAPEAKPAKKK
mgnify:CR=1 FL=1